jgi:ribosomal protein S18 acetylase RimI-like enzyme
MDLTSVTLCDAQPHHFDAIVRIEEEAGGSSLVVLTRGQALAEAMGRGHYVTVALHDDDVAGWIWFGVDLGRGAEEVGYVYRVAVTRPLARSGIGVALLAHAQATLAARGVVRVRTTVDAENVDARAFFESRGYRLDAVTMERAL